MKLLTPALLAALLLFGATPQAQAQSAAAALPLNVQALGDLTQVDLALLPVLENPGRMVGLISPHTLNATLATVSTLPGVSSQPPIGAIVRGLLSNF